MGVSPASATSASANLGPLVIKALEALAVEVYLETRLDLSTLKKGSKEVKSTDGRIFIADLIMLCTGQTPHSTFLQRLAPETINPRTKYATVLRSLQLAPLEQAESANEQQGIPVEDAVDSVDAALVKLNLRDESEKRPHYTNIFVIGDVADAFGAIKAGHTAYAQAKVAATNIVKLISGDEQLEQYSHEGLAIKVTVGLVSRRVSVPIHTLNALSREKPHTRRMAKSASRKTILRI